MAKNFHNKIGRYSVRLLGPQLDNNEFGFFNSSSVYIFGRKKISSYTIYSMTLVEQNNSVQTMSLTSTSVCCVHSNVYGLGNIH